MSIYNCIPNGCGRVLWREYLPPKVRWKYPGENWNEIEGDSYEIENLPAQCCGTWDITVYFSVPGCNGGQAYSGAGVVRIPYGTYQRMEYRTDNPWARSLIQVVYYDCYQNKEKTLPVWSSTGKSSIVPNCQDPLAIHDMPGSTYRVVDAVRVDAGIEECNTCWFTVYKGDKIVHTELKDDCPQVEQLSCRLSDIPNEIKIEKIPYLQRIEVVDFAYQNFGLNVFRRAIPDECLNIYRNLTTVLPPAPGGFPVPANNVQDHYEFILQICSAPGCPSPEYNVVCDCDCEKCPTNTCAKECGNYICCYDTTSGIATKQIEIEKYCGDEI